MFSPLLLFFVILFDILFTWSGLLVYILSVNGQIPTVPKNDLKNTYYQEIENKGKLLFILSTKTCLCPLLLQPFWFAFTNPELFRALFIVYDRVVCTSEHFTIQKNESAAGF